jgi:hypothetical protein
MLPSLFVAVVTACAPMQVWQFDGFAKHVAGALNLQGSLL